MFRCHQNRLNVFFAVVDCWLWLNARGDKPVIFSVFVTRRIVGVIWVIRELVQLYLVVGMNFVITVIPIVS